MNTELAMLVYRRKRVMDMTRGELIASGAELLEALDAQINARALLQCVEMQRVNDRVEIRLDAQPLNGVAEGEEGA